MFSLIKLLLSPKTVLGIGLGAAAAWFSDPERGPERRNQAVAALKQRAPGASSSSYSTPSYSSATAPEPSLWTPDDPADGGTTGGKA